MIGKVVSKLHGCMGTLRCVRALRHRRLSLRDPGHLIEGRHLASRTRATHRAVFIRNHEK